MARQVNFDFNPFVWIIDSPMIRFVLRSKFTMRCQNPNYLQNSSIASWRQHAKSDVHLFHQLNIQFLLQMLHIPNHKPQHQIKKFGELLVSGNPSIIPFIKEFAFELEDHVLNHGPHLFPPHLSHLICSNPIQSDCHHL